MGTPYTPGDFNGDGTVDVRDSSGILVYAVRDLMNINQIPVTEQAFRAGDVDNNGILDANDASLIIASYAITSAEAFRHLTLSEIIAFKP